LRSFSKRLAFGVKLGLPPARARQLAKLKTPAQIQDFIDKIRPNFELDGDTCLSAGEALIQRHAHCIEAAFIAACALWMNGEPPLLLDFQARGDDDHVVAIYRQHGCWGAISKSNHVWLRNRDAVYRNLRELAMSYFHEYVGDGCRTMLTYSVPFDLRRFDPKLWVSGKKNCWEIAGALDATRHYRLINKAQVRSLRAPDPIEHRADKLRDFRPPRNMRKNKEK
jgi:hypothetical protein